MVAIAHHHNFVIAWFIDYYRRRKCFRSVYLFTVLMNKTYKNILIMVSGFALTGLALHQPLLLVLSFIFGLGSFFSSKIALVLEKYWLKLAHQLGTINAVIILSLVFFLFLTPISGLRKLLRKSVDWNRLPETSNFITGHKVYTPNDLKNIW